MKALFILISILSSAAYSDSGFRAGKQTKEIQARLDIKIIVPAFCRLSSVRPYKYPKANIHCPGCSEHLETQQKTQSAGYEMITPLYFACNIQPYPQLQLENLLAGAQTQLKLSYFEDCRETSNTLFGYPVFKLQQAFLCAPLNYQPQANEALITLTIP